MKKQLFFAFLTLLVLGTGAAQAAEPLRSPYPLFIPMEGAIEEKDCPKPPAALHDMEYDSVYTDRSQGVSIVDPKARKTYKKETKTIRHYEQKIEGWTESSFTKQNMIPCVIYWMRSWADEDAMLGGTTNFQGESVRKWTLAVLSSHYLHIRHVSTIAEQDKTLIEGWLRRLMQQVIADYNREPQAKSRNNNHMIWAAWAVMITSVALDDLKAFNWSKEKYFKTLRMIRQDGTLPLEVERQGKAFHYHIFGAGPLVLMAETLEVNGIKAYEAEDQALGRLVTYIVTDMQNNQLYTRSLTGKKQDLTGTLTRSNLTWLKVYTLRVQHNVLDKWIDKLSPMTQRRLGGNLTRLFPKE